MICDMTPEEAYEFALGNPGCDIEKYQEIACGKVTLAYYFAVDVPAANIEYCQKHACLSTYWAPNFSAQVCESDIEYCYKPSSVAGKRYVERFILKKL